METKISANRRKVIKPKIKSTYVDYIYRALLLLVILVIWHISAVRIGSSLLLPKPLDVMEGFVTCITDPEIVKNVFITLQRVLKGFFYALAVGLPVGLLMGFSNRFESVLSPLVDSIRQVPIMAWVPLTIVWFGIGDGPTVFLIAFAGIFPIILNTIQGIKSISKDYYNAARSMGASPFSIFINVMLPAALPVILTGARLAISTGWMSVIWAEFIATSAGIGYSMVRAQTMMNTELLIGLMIFAALIGFIIDRGLKFINKSLCRWRFEA